MANISNNIIMNKRKTAITITFGDQAENHKGMQIIGKMADTGFSNEEVERARDKFEEEGCSCEFVNLKERLLSSWDNSDEIEIEDKKS